MHLGADLDRLGSGGLPALMPPEIRGAHATQPRLKTASENSMIREIGFIIGIFAELFWITITKGGSSTL
ncbi:hypothetical protein [Sphingomonas sp. GC_Shp_1]|uniref:hypothetical protein n=2 Tax=Sphingomonas TaxID=13687 RepID=UPI00226B1025|nr:hypothetical protein [Sphingomonas sp. GC_Shp_1]